MRRVPRERRLRRQWLQVVEGNPVGPAAGPLVLHVLGDGSDETTTDDQHSLRLGRVDLKISRRTKAQPCQHLLKDHGNEIGKILLILSAPGGQRGQP